MDAVTHIRLKLERAEEHLNAVNDALTVFYSSRPCVATEQFDAKNQRDIYRMQVAKQPDPRIGIFAGDYVQNLRACLDHLAWQLALLKRNPPERPTRIEFPISDNADISTESRKRLTQLLGFFPDSARLKIEGLQPYMAGPTDAFRHTHPLYVLDALCNIDKHRVIPIRGMMMEMKIPVIPGTQHKWLDQGTIEISIPRPHPKLPPPRAGVQFGDEESGVDVIPNVLAEIYDFVRKDALPQFACFFPQDPWFKSL